MNKVIHFLFLVIFANAIALGGTDPRTLNNQRFENWKRAASELPPLQAMNNEEKFEQLGKILRGLGEPQEYLEHAEEASALQNRLQQEVVTIPGHAAYFADKIKKEQASVQYLPRRPVPGRLEYDRNRYYIIVETLIRLPSPETIQVLGQFLWDDKDGHDWDPDDDWDSPQNNSYLAVQALRGIGLTDRPSVSDINLWRAWYEEIKSGKRSFSFKGQNVEYRFNPDGSVSTTPIKVEEERPAPAPSKPEVTLQRPTIQIPTSTPTSMVQSARRLWIAVGLIVGLIAAVVLWRKGKKFS